MSTVLPGTRAPLLETLAGTDHKRIGVAVGAVAFAFFLAGGVLALLMRSELAQPGLQVVSLNSYNALFTMHGSTMIYLFVTPVALAMGLYLVPLQVGAAQPGGPRWALAGTVAAGARRRDHVERASWSPAARRRRPGSASTRSRTR